MYTYKMFDVGSVRELLGLPNPSAAKIPASLAKPERNPLIGDRWGYELANREIGRQATAVGVGTGGSNPASSSMRPRTFGLPQRARRCRNSVTLAGLDRWFESAFLQRRVERTGEIDDTLYGRPKRSVYRGPRLAWQGGAGRTGELTGDRGPMVRIHLPPGKSPMRTCSEKAS